LAVVPVLKVLRVTACNFSRVLRMGNPVTARGGDAMVRIVAGTKYIPALTGIRAVAASMVLLLHTSQNVADGAWRGFEPGYLGVDLFFILSGFVITHVYLASLARPGGEALAVFLWHRFVRLYPVHLTMVLGLVAVVYGARAAGVGFHQPESWRGEDLVWHLLLVHAWGPLDTAGWNAPSWSISAEWFAYLLFPLLALALARLRSGMAALLVAAAALVATMAALAAGGWPLNSWLGPPALIRVSGEFLAGAAMCRAVMLGTVPRSGDLVGLVALAAIAFAAWAEAPDGILVGLALLVLAAATARGPLEKVLACGPVVWVGEISYSIYMVHFPVLIISRRALEATGLAGLASPLQFALLIAIVIAAAAAMYYAVERPARTRLRDLVALAFAARVQA
jgi:peptidoglycan/LPS O-acetylase OafA/YrhL